jgi:hypothetical protein
VTGTVSDSKSSPVQHKSAGTSKGPLKSIMKKKEKIQRKESDITTVSKRGSHFKEFLESHVSKSPCHSVSMSGMSSASGVVAVNGDTNVADSNNIQLILMRSSNGSNRQSLDADSARTSASRSSVVVTSDSMDDAIFGRGAVQGHLSAPRKNSDADESMDSENDGDEDSEEKVKNEDDLGNFNGSGTKL